MPRKICVITGVGPGNGAALSRRFAENGYRVAMLARTEDKLGEMESSIAGSRGFACDVGDPSQVAATFARVREELGLVSVLVHNAGSGMFSSFLDTTPEMMELSWRVNTLGLLACGQEAARDMLAAGGGAIVVIGATASWRGGADFAPFASAKAAQRALAQSMARGLGPRGIHVAYVVIDGVIDMPVTRGFMPDRPDEAFLKPEAIADTVLHVVGQDCSAWTFEVDLRPFGESW